MTQERLSVRRIREVLRLKFECGLSHRAIARSCAISHSTVREYIHRAQAAGLAWPLPEALDEDQLQRLFFPKEALFSSRVIAQPDWKLIHQELRRKGVTLRLLWLEYRKAHPDGYGYSRFCECYRLWAKTLNPPMRLTHKAGEKLFVDYAGHIVPTQHPVRAGALRAQPVGANGLRSGQVCPCGRPCRSSIPRRERGARRMSLSPRWEPAVTPTPKPSGPRISPTGSAATCGPSPSSAGRRLSRPERGANGLRCKCRCAAGAPPLRRVVPGALPALGRRHRTRDPTAHRGRTGIPHPSPTGLPLLPGDPSVPG